MYKEIPIGARFGKLEVTGGRIMVPTNQGTRRSGCYPCKCDCGSTTLIRGAILKRSQSCGCERGNRKHLGSKTRLYKRWIGVKDRCQRPEAINYHHYGGKGIRLCEEWQTWEPFRDWAFANGYQPELWLERRDASGDYCPENCLWATTATQARNRSTNRHVTAWGETKCVADWCKDSRCLISRNVLYKRLIRGMEAEAAMTSR